MRWNVDFVLHMVRLYQLFDRLDKLVYRIVDVKSSPGLPELSTCGDPLFLIVVSNGVRTMICRIKKHITQGSQTVASLNGLGPSQMWRR